MATETYKYFQPTVQYLRTDYAPANTAILFGGDDAESDPATLTSRHCLNKLSLPANGTDRLFIQGNTTTSFSGNGSTTSFTMPFAPIGLAALSVKIGSVTQAQSSYSISGTTLTFTSAPASGTNNIVVTVPWIRVSDLFYSAVSPYLTTDELATVVSTAPTGFTVSSDFTIMNPTSLELPVIVDGDSISAGTLTTNPSSNAINAYPKLAIELIPGEVLRETGTLFGATTPATSTGKQMYSRNYSLCNFAIGGSNWDNEVDQGLGENAYPRRQSLKYNQRVRTLPMKFTNCIFMYWLGTNDIAYDATVTGAIAFARAQARVAQFKTDFPNVKLIVGTLIKRTESSSLNNRIGDYNALLRANYASVGIDVLCDFEANISQLNLTTGDTTNTTYYADGIHPTNAGHALLAPVFKNAILDAKALF